MSVARIRVAFPTASGRQRCGGSGVRPGGVAPCSRQGKPSQDVPSASREARSYESSSRARRATAYHDPRHPARHQSQAAPTLMLFASCSRVTCRTSVQRTVPRRDPEPSAYPLTAFRIRTPARRGRGVTVSRSAAHAPPSWTHPQRRQLGVRNHVGRLLSNRLDRERPSRPQPARMEHKHAGVRA